RAAITSAHASTLSISRAGYATSPAPRDPLKLALSLQPQLIDMRNLKRLKVLPPRAPCVLGIVWPAQGLAHRALR
ncbi:MAG: hypothetical protein ACJ8A0_05440, partial [Microvirga sp.]